MYFFNKIFYVTVIIICVCSKTFSQNNIKELFHGIPLDKSNDEIYSYLKNSPNIIEQPYILMKDGSQKGNSYLKVKFKTYAANYFLGKLKEVKKINQYVDSLKIELSYSVRGTKDIKYITILTNDYFFSNFRKAQQFGEKIRLLIENEIEEKPKETLPWRRKLHMNHQYYWGESLSDAKYKVHLKRIKKNYSTVLYAVSLQYKSDKNKINYKSKIRYCAGLDDDDLVDCVHKQIKKELLRLKELTSSSKNKVYWSQK